MNTQTPKPRSRGRRVLKGILGLIIVIALIHGIATLILGHMVENRLQAIKAKGDPISMSDLVSPPIPDSENGAVIYDKAMDDLHSYREKQAEEDKTAVKTHKQFVSALSVISPHKENRDPDVWDFARRYARPANDILPKLEEAAKKPKCRFKNNWQDGTGASFSHLAELRESARTLGVNAAVDAKDGKIDEAIRSMTAAYRLSDSIKDEPTVIAMLLRIAILKIDSNALKSIAGYTHIDKAHARKLYDVLSNIDVYEHSILAMNGERAVGIGTFKTVAKRGGKNIVYFGEERVPFLLRISWSYAWRPFLYADELKYLDLMERQVDITNHSYREIESSGVEDRWESELYGSPFYVLVTKMITPVLEKAKASRDSGSASVSGDQIFLALLAYKDSFGEYPRTLDELRAKLGWKLREDPFTGKDFIYKREGAGFLLYSIGMNLKDDKGLNNKYDARILGPAAYEYDDITWRM